MRLILPRWISALALCHAAFAAAPVIQGVVNGANFQPGIASATWITITGTNLSTTSRGWSSTDFAFGNLPSVLDGVSVTINSRPAYIAYISATQINALVPDDPATGNVPVQVTNSLGASNTLMVNKQTAAPALFAYSQAGGRYAVVQAGLTYELIAPFGSFGNAVRTVQAAPGENLILYATGLGPVSPAQPTGQLVTNPAHTALPINVSIGGTQAAIQFAGLVGAGLYQLNVTVPQLPSGDAALVLSVNGIVSTGLALVPVQAPAGPIGGQTAPVLSDCLSGQVDYLTYSVGRLSLGQADEASIGGTRMCATCTVRQPLYPEFVLRMERSLTRSKNVRACYDATGLSTGDHEPVRASPRAARRHSAPAAHFRHPSRCLKRPLSISKRRDVLRSPSARAF